ncbi:MAG: PepSY-like domain-containing protein [Bacteroidaceae bacterium]|nr:PepSY-like domain-containing protein [Bacteroidaceae bacterium]
MRKFFFVMLLLPALLFTACGGDDDKNNSAVTGILLNDAILNYIQTNYEGAVIKSYELEPNGLIDVDIMHDAVSKDVYFMQNGQWVLTKWDVSLSALPAVVVDAVLLAYPEYVIDDADFVQSPSGNYYSINIEKGNFERNLRVALDGSSVDEV